MYVRIECWGDFNMAVTLRRLAVVAWRRQEALCNFGLSRCFANTSTSEDEGVLKRLKKFIVGEGTPADLSEPSSERYFGISEVTEPAVYNMGPEEIRSKIDNIVRELKTSDKVMSDIVSKYKVLNKCYQEFGVIVPNNRLSQMDSINNVLEFYTLRQRPSENTFQSIDMDNLPPNVQIGGKLPRKQI